MKYSLKHDLLFFLQYVIMIVLWYWMFVDNPVVRFMGGFAIVGYSLLLLMRPQWFPNRPGLTGRIFPDRTYDRFRKNTSWSGILVGIVILSGYRITTVRSMGIIALLLLISIIPIYYHWIKSSDEKERLENRGFWAFAISTAMVFTILGGLFITMGDREIKLLTETSPYPMMVFYALMGMWHYRVVRKKERNYIEA